MAKLIPGRVRNAGISLYEEGKVTFISENANQLLLKVDAEEVTFTEDDSLVQCTCDFFVSKGYCEHIAAVEAFLKNDAYGKDLAAQLFSKEKEKETKQVETSFGSLFLDGITMNEDDRVKYRLSAEGVEAFYTKEIHWTLRLNRLPDDRAYVIRDIASFLQSVKKESSYQIGKGYFEPLSYLQFDEESQNLIHFLWKLLPDSDRSISDRLFPSQGRYLNLPAGFFEEGVALLQSLYEFTVELKGANFSHVSFESLTAESSLYQFEVFVHRQFLELIVAEKQVQVLFNFTYLYYNGVFYRLTRRQQKIAQALASLPISADLKKHLNFSVDDQAKLAASLLDFKTLGFVKAPKAFEIRDFEVLFFLEMAEQDKVSLQMTFDYGNVKVSNREDLNQLPFTSHFKKEEKIIRVLREEGFPLGFSSHKTIDTPEAIYHFFNQTLPRLERLGQVMVSEELSEKGVSSVPRLIIDSQGGLLDISFDFSDVEASDVDDAMQALINQSAYFVSKTGKLLIFDDETKKISQVLQNLRHRKVENGHLQLNQASAFQVMETLKDNETVSFTESFESLIYDLRHPEMFKLPKLDVKAQVRDYQQLGIKWLSMLAHYGFGGILADDMGLGKTLQTIAFLSSRLSDQDRVLILAPSSLIYNWKDEFSKFTPDLDVVVSYGAKSQRDQLISEGHQVMVTSYASFRQDFEEYRQGSYTYLILDEAQVMKNSQTKIAQHLREFEVQHCFALSGTPIENHLLEIWSIFQIVLPGLLPSKKEFLKLSAKEIARFIKPFILRRRKEEVLPELPELIEMTYPNELTEEQKAVYLAQLRQMQESVRGATDDQINGRKIEILSGITRLRQICDTPKLFMDYLGNSGKLESLRQLLFQIKANGRRALIFSQFRGMLDLVENELNDLDMTAYKLTGSTPAKERQDMTRAFNKGAKDAFLISLKAGGVGLNLTGADTVILVDLWWNPAVEMQAIGRAHRLGQKENVEVYRLITKGTIEEKILELQESKKHLVTTVLDGNESRSSLSVEDIKEILGIQ
ncbi:MULTISPECIES: DEAD/DEAH box helicase [Streptococcus]|uniref:SNF2 helicase associated domain-containing protein n=1 Tax=Streptococcus caledonicus TaxID=2614158 RepID=A0ABW0UD74_9STRE|nr:DEAD/DEAH box helicase [Streptococcus sp. S784/96/1]